MGFVRATKERAKLRLALVGPTGSGKTYTGLLIAKHLAKGGRVGVIDTERGSASKYAGDVADFDVLELETYSPLTYVKAINEAADAGYPVLLIDSATHAWTGEDGALDQIDKKASGSLGKFGAWREVTPMHRQLVDAMLGYPGHLIATMRAKTEYLIEEGKNGKKSVRKIGTAPIQRDGISYEFDVVGDMDHSHVMTVTKSRCAALADRAIRKPGADVAQELLDWLDDGAKPIGAQVMELIAKGELDDARALANENRGRLSKADSATIRAALAAATPLPVEEPAEETSAEDNGSEHDAAAE